MIDVNEIQEVIYEYYVEVMKEKQREIPFAFFFDILYSKHSVIYFDGFLFLHRTSDNTVHVYRGLRYRNKHFSLKSLKDYFNSLPKDVVAPVLKTAIPVAKKTVERLGFKIVKETDIHYIMQRND